MNVLLAHHLEAHHYPVLVSLFVAGCYIGWQLLSRWCGNGPVTTAGLRAQSSPSNARD
jgi:hypothetical protein